MVWKNDRRVENGHAGVREYDTERQRSNLEDRSLAARLIDRPIDGGYSLRYRPWRQRSKNGWLTQEALRQAYRGIIVSPDILARIGPAVNSATSVMFDAQYDGRWARCRRPFIVTGGELSIDMLDLGYNAMTKVYDAPFQVKANNGIYLIDDFGRQKTSPAEVLNRWIVPMDRRVDYLSFHTGGKVEVPFETFLIFSTNLQPESLGDEAFLRRIQYKMFLQNPSREEFVEIFQSLCASQSLECPSATLGAFIRKHYEATAKRFRRCQPRDVISHAIDLINFERLPFELTEQLLDRAFASCFVSSRMDE